MTRRSLAVLALLLPLTACDLQTAEEKPKDVVVVKNDSYGSSDALIAAAAKSGFTCPAPKRSMQNMESAPTEYVQCSNNRTLVSFQDTITGASPRGTFILGLDDEVYFQGGPWLIGKDWALHGPGAAKMQPTMGGRLLRHPTPEALKGY